MCVLGQTSEHAKHSVYRLAFGQFFGLTQPNMPICEWFLKPFRYHMLCNMHKCIVKLRTKKFLSIKTFSSFLFPQTDQNNSFREIVYGYHVSGGENLCTTCSLSNCLRMCAELPDSTCQAVDYNWQAMSCHMHRNRTACHPVIPRVTCAHYRRVSCGDGMNNCDVY